MQGWHLASGTQVFTATHCTLSDVGRVCVLEPDCLGLNLVLPCSSCVTFFFSFFFFFGGCTTWRVGS